MTNNEPDWYIRLKGNPIHEITFTNKHIEQIEQQAYESGQVSQIGSQRRRRRINRLRASSSAAILLIAITVVWGQWQYKAIDSKDETLPAPKPSISAAVTAPLPAQAPDFGVPIKLTQLKGNFKNQLPFQTEKVDAISIYSHRTKHTVEVPKERLYVILQNLNGLDLQAALLSVSPNDRYAYEPNANTLTFKVGTKSYALDYDEGSNTYGIRGTATRLYASDHVWIMMQNLLDRDFGAEFDKLVERARQEAAKQPIGTEESKDYDRKRFTVNKLDYDGWNQHFLALSSGIKYYDTDIEQIGLIQFQSQTRGRIDMIKLSNTVIFTSNAYQTPDGITVGLTEQEVLNKLGKPNKKSDTEWGYRMGDYVRFHLYFDQGKVRFMMLTMPL